MKSKFARHLGKTSHNAKRTCQTKMAESGQNVDKQSEEGSSVSDTINKQGWLSKRSRLSKRWDKRWCCLKKNELSYGISAEEQHKVVLLEGCEMSDCNIDKKQFAFRIKPRGAKRVYFFCADTEQDQQEWMQAICFAKASGHLGDGSQACTVQ